MDHGRLYDRYALPHLPKDGPYGADLRGMFLAHAVDLVEWVVDAGSAALGLGGGHASFPLDAVADHVLACAPRFPGSGLTRIHPHDRLSAMVDAGDRDLFGRMLVDLMVLHLVRAADAVSVGIANERTDGPRIDVTSPARRRLGEIVAARAAQDVARRLAPSMAALDAIAFAAAAAWTRRSVH